MQRREPLIVLCVNISAKLDQQLHIPDFFGHYCKVKRRCILPVFDFHIVSVLNDQNQNAQVPDVSLSRAVHHCELSIHHCVERSPKVFNDQIDDLFVAFYHGLVDCHYALMPILVTDKFFQLLLVIFQFEVQKANYRGRLLIDC
jgi:hypothetical protein